MSGISVSGALKILGDIDARAKTNMVDLGEVEEHVDEGVFITFQACGVRFLALMEELKEIIYVPAHITRVPLVQPWMLGVANVRGSLMPIVDLQQFLCGNDRGATADSRVLVVDRGGLLVGLQVPAVYGLRHVPLTSAGEFITDDLPWLSDFVEGGYEVDKEIWPALKIDALVEHPNFRVAAV